MDFNQLLEILNKFARENTFFSIIIIAVSANLITEVVKKLLLYAATSTKYLAEETGRGITNWNRKNIEFALNNYREDIVKVEKIRNNDQSVHVELIRDLYYCLTQFFVVIVLYLIVLKLDNPILFYSLLGASSRPLFSIFAITYYNNNLLKNARNFEKYKQRKERRIELLENILNK